MKTLVLGIIGLVLVSFTFILKESNNQPARSQISKIQQNKKDAVVYICKGPKSYAYHSRSRCSGLNNCSTEIYEVNESEALSMRRTACQKCH